MTAIKPLGVKWGEQTFAGTWCYSNVSTSNWSLKSRLKNIGACAPGRSGVLRIKCCAPNMEPESTSKTRRALKCRKQQSNRHGFIQKVMRLQLQQTFRCSFCRPCPRLAARVTPTATKRVLRINIQEVIPMWPDKQQLCLSGSDRRGEAP